jgi:glycosyltransferase involved in cell wall biosynthesis
MDLKKGIDTGPVLEGSPLISLVIPARNEAEYLPGLLDSVEEAVRRFDGAGNIEVIVSDNGSTDSTARIARQRGCVVVTEQRRIIAAVRNSGASRARGRILAFTDADNLIHPETFNLIAETMSSDCAVGGTTGVELERMSLGIALTYYCVMPPMILVTGMDTGVVFCNRRDFCELGGYNEGVMFGEDVDLLVRLKKLGRKKGLKLVRLKRIKAVTSMRKFDKHGEWHFFPVVARGLYAMFFPSKRFREFATRYWYDDRD